MPATSFAIASDNFGSGRRLFSSNWSVAPGSIDLRIIQRVTDAWCICIPCRKTRKRFSSQIQHYIFPFAVHLLRSFDHKLQYLSGRNDRIPAKSSEENAALIFLSVAAFTIPIVTGIIDVCPFGQIQRSTFVAGLPVASLAFPAWPV